MANIRLELPDELLQDLGGSAEAAGREILLAAAFHWCRRGDLSTSKAAQLAGRTYAGFLEAAVQRKAVLYDYDSEEIKAECSRPPAENADLEAIKQNLVRAQSARG